MFQNAKQHNKILSLMNFQLFKGLFNFLYLQVLEDFIQNFIGNFHHVVINSFTN